jgi:hypothetical protein
VGAGDSHTAGLGVKRLGKRLAQRLQPPADPLLRFEYEDFVTGAGEFVRRNKARHAGADHDDALRRTGRQAVGDYAAKVSCIECHDAPPEDWAPIVARAR